MMELTLEQIRAITLGALDIKQDADGFHFQRMTPSQESAFYRESPELGPRAAAPSGVCLDFFTDATWLELHYHQVHIVTERTYYGFDVLVNGILTYHTGADDCRQCSTGSFRLALDGKENRIQLYLPTVLPAAIRSVALSDGASLRPYRPSRRILMHGDSITQGYDAVYPSACYANRLARYYDAEIINQAIGGACFYADVLERVENVDFVTVAYGTNDWRKRDSNASLRFHAEAFLQRLAQLYPDVPVFVILPIWRSDMDVPYTAGDFMECRSFIGTTAQRYGLTVLDNFDLVPHDPRFFWDQRLHPNEHGFYLYATGLCQMIDQHLNG